MCQYAKTVEQIFKILIKNFWRIFEILHLELVSAAAAAELSGPTCLTNYYIIITINKIRRVHPQWGY